MSPDYFVIPMIMKQSTDFVERMKTDIIWIDCFVFICFIFLVSNTDKKRFNTFCMKWIESKLSGKMNSIIISTETKQRTIKFRALMHYLAKCNNETIFQLKEDPDFDWDDVEKRSFYLVDQHKEFKITDDIYGKIRDEQKEKSKNQQVTEMVDYNIIKIYSYKHSLLELQEWIDNQVAIYKDYLKKSSNDKQLFITISNDGNGFNTVSNNNKSIKSSL